jgi:hypothetical protein
MLHQNAPFAKLRPQDTNANNTERTQQGKKAWLAGTSHPQLVPLPLLMLLPPQLQLQHPRCTTALVAVA